LISSKGWKTTPLSTSLPFPAAAGLHTVLPKDGERETRGGGTLTDGWLAAAAGDGETLSIISVADWLSKCVDCAWEEAGGGNGMGWVCAVVID
jgi:hypothetical protein